jgi:hypothetical protein
MRRHGLFLSTAALCLTISAMASDGKQNAQPGPSQIVQTNAGSNAADGSNGQTSSARRDCKDKAPKRSKRERDRSGSAANSQIPQNQVEYGGGG